MSGAPRSYLFVPGHRPERFEKALASGAEAVILDLEDAVPIDRKDEARAAVGAFVARPRAAPAGGAAMSATDIARVPAGYPQLLVRTNAAGTPWFDADLAACRQVGARLDAVMLPKAENPADVAALHLPQPLIALIESALGLANARAIAAVPAVARLAFGAIDFQLDLGSQATFDELLAYRSELVLASRLAGLPPPIDSPSVVFDDPAPVEDEARRARRLGFGAKLCIHPKQLDPVRHAFAPSADQLAWARRVVDAAAASGGAAVALDGRMIDKPVILAAEALLRDA